jgi:hypothetical protein
MRRLACALALAALLSPVAAQAAVSAGAYGSIARFDRLTGQKTESGLVFLGWDQGRTWGSKYEFFLNKLGRRPHIALPGRVRFISFFNGPAGGGYDIGTKPRSRAAYRRFVVPLLG